MKEIKAYIRRRDIDEVIEGLRAAGAPGVSVIEIHPIGYGYEPNRFERHVARLVQRYRYLEVVKLEIICEDDQAEALLHVIHEQCHTGEAGDGMIFVSSIEEAMRMSDGARGGAALKQPVPAGLKVSA